MATILSLHLTLHPGYGSQPSDYNTGSRPAVRILAGTTNVSFLQNVLTNGHWGVLSSELRRPGREANHSPLSIVDVKNK